MVAPTEAVADLPEREVGELPGEVDGDLAGPEHLAPRPGPVISSGETP